MRNSRARSETPTEDIFKAKIAVIGDTGSGKTSLISAYTAMIDNKDPNSLAEALLTSRTTIGCDFITRNILTPNELKIKMCIWDTAGQEKFRALSRNFYFGSHGVIMCFDLTKEITEEEILDWHEEVTNNIDKSCCKIIVGTKSDLADAEGHASKKLAQIAEKLDLRYLETSSMTGKNIVEIFDIIVMEVERRQAVFRNGPEGSFLYQERNSMSLSVVGNQHYDESKSGKCC